MMTHDALQFPVLFLRKFSQFYAITVETTVGGRKKINNEKFPRQARASLKAAEPLWNSLDDRCGGKSFR